MTPRHQPPCPGGQPMLQPGACITAQRGESLLVSLLLVYCSPCTCLLCLLFCTVPLKFRFFQKKRRAADCACDSPAPLVAPPSPEIQYVGPPDPPMLQAVSPSGNVRLAFRRYSTADKLDSPSLLLRMDPRLILHSPTMVTAATILWLSFRTQLPGSSDCCGARGSPDHAAWRPCPPPQLSSSFYFIL